MTGKITGISGPTVSVDVKGLKLYERVYIGHAHLTGEVVRIESERAVLQVYEETRGLALGEPVRATGRSLSIKLGPGLLSVIFDGLQRPLERLRDETGPFISHAGDPEPIDMSGSWVFHPLKKKGDYIQQHEPVGYIEEGTFRHYISSDEDGTLSMITEGEFRLDAPVAVLDDRKKIYGYHEWPVREPRPFKKQLPSHDPLVTGQRSIDFLFTLAQGGTAVFPGGFGTGKTILEQSVAKYADVDIVVYVGCGERGNEMAEMIEEFGQLKDPWTQQKLMDRTILCVNTSNMPVAAREASIYTAVTMAEYFRDMGYHVLFLADSISRWAEASREISTSLEEMPGEEGYPTYLASRLSGFLERAGKVETLNGKTGSLSMLLAVSPPGGDLTEPVTQSCLRTSGAFIMLDTALAHRRHFPAVNWFQSYTLYASELLEYCRKKISPDWEEIQIACREILQKEESIKDVAEIVGVEGLQDADRLVMHTAERIRTEFLMQNAYTEDAFSPPDKTLSTIGEIVAFYQTASEQLKQGVSLDDILSENEK